MFYLNVMRPAWLLANPGDKLNQLFHNRAELWRHGRIVWGHVVQANVLLFETGFDDCPGEIVYSLDDPQTVDPDILTEVAEKLFSLKGRTPNAPALAGIADYLTDEFTRVFGLEVPQAISPNLRCHVSSTMFHRRHLPDKRLSASEFPVIVSPDSPHYVLPLPSRYWPEEFLHWWKEVGTTSE